jgi:hypothetical protein
LAALTIFAICLYFLGQALAMEPTRSGYVLLTAGIVFGCFGIASSLVSLYPMVRLFGFAQATPKTAAAVLADNKCPEVYSDFSEEPGRSRQLAAYYYGVGIVLSNYNSDDDDLRRSKRYFECALALREDFAYARLTLASVKSRLGSLDLKEPYSSLPMREKLQEIDLPQAQVLLQRSGLDLSAAQRNGLVFRTALNGLIRRDDEALVFAESAAQEALDLVRAGKMLANPDEAGMLHFNLGLLRLARGRFDDGKKSYQEGMEAGLENGLRGLENGLRVSALTDLEIVTTLRCEDEQAAKGEKFDCAGLRSATVEIKKAVLGMHGGSKLPSPVRNLPREDFTASATANHLFARVRGLDPESDGLWLVWSRLERSWNSWRTLQSVSLPIKAPRKGSDIVTIRNGAIEVQYSFVRSYSGTKECLEEGRYRAELYSHGTLVAASFVDRPPLQMKAARFPELNVQLCVPSGWNIVLETAAAAQQRSNYGLIRGFRNAAGAPAAFVVDLYLPTSSDGLASCLVPKNAINCAVGTLMRGKLISGNEPRLDFEDRAARSGLIDNRTLIYRTLTTSDGGVHVIVAKADSGSADQLRELLESAEVIYSENNMEAAAQK